MKKRQQMILSLLIGIISVALVVYCNLLSTRVNQEVIDKWEKINETVD